MTGDLILGSNELLKEVDDILNESGKNYSRDELKQIFAARDQAILEMLEKGGSIRTKLGTFKLQRLAAREVFGKEIPERDKAIFTFAEKYRIRMLK